MMAAVAQSELNRVTPPCVGQMPKHCGNLVERDLCSCQERWRGLKKHMQRCENTHMNMFRHSDNVLHLQVRIQLIYQFAVLQLSVTSCNLQLPIERAQM